MEKTMPEKVDSELQQLAVGLLSDSLITGGRRLVTDRGWIRWLHTLIWILCLGFLIYMTAIYISIYLSNAVTLSVTLEYPESVILPATTVCTRESIDRQKFCAASEKHCFENRTVRPEYEDFTRTASRQDFRKYRINLKDSYGGSSCGNTLRCLDPSTFRFLPLLDVNGDRTICIVFNQRVASPNFTNIPHIKMVSDHAFSEIAKINMLGYFTMLPNMMKPEFKVTLFSVHSPFTLWNPFEDESIENGFFELLIVKFRMTEIVKLPAPYTTNCRNYISEYRTIGRGPVSKNMCIQECIYKAIRDSCGCFLIGTLYFSEDRFCEKADMKCVDKVDSLDCQRGCKDDCRSIKYDYSLSRVKGEMVYEVMIKAFGYIKEMDQIMNMTDKREGKGVGYAIEGSHKVVYTYHPKYNTLNFYSTIGGYLSIWLGLSILEILDFFVVAYKVAVGWLAQRRLEA